MMVWVVFLVLIALALYLLLRPLLSTAAAAGDTRSSELAVYRDQLKELEVEIASGIVMPGDAEAARTEIKRKMLAVAPAPEPARNAKRAVRIASIAIAAGVPAVALGIYLSVGQPGLVGNRPPPSSVSLSDIEKLVTRLAEHMKQNPGDVQGWRMLAMSYASLDRFAEAARAYERAVALDADDAGLQARYGEALVRSLGGPITPQAEKIFERALAIDPQEPRAQFFRGLALEQQNKPKEALAQWVKIIREGKADPAWIPALRQRASELATKLKLDPAKEIPGTTAGPSPEK